MKQILQTFQHDIGMRHSSYFFLKMILILGWCKKIQPWLPLHSSLFGAIRLNFPLTIIVFNCSTTLSIHLSFLKAIWNLNFIRVKNHWSISTFQWFICVLLHKGSSNTRNYFMMWINLLYLNNKQKDRYIGMCHSIINVH